MAIRRVTLALGAAALAIAGVAAGVLIVSLLVAEDITDEVLDAIEST